ncbi:hypothetical protein TcYC6_0002050 [Trypanosoma cruzi]|nr:hypothetical protein TcYC6_0002050 [Trypanosoma cruzi]
MPSGCRGGGRAATKVSCCEATAIERTFRGEGPVQCPAVGAQPRCLDILEADDAMFSAGQLACLWKLADPAVAEIASWHFCLGVEWRLGCVRSDFCAVRCFSVWGKPCHRNRGGDREAVEGVPDERTDSGRCGSCVPPVWRHSAGISSSDAVWRAVSPQAVRRPPLSSGEQLPSRCSGIVVGAHESGVFR